MEGKVRERVAVGVDLERVARGGIEVDALRGSFGVEAQDEDGAIGGCREQVEIGDVGQQVGGVKVI